MSRYTISIIAFNKLDATKRCIESVIAHSKDYDLILTDNGSRDNTLKFFKSVQAQLRPGQVKVIHNDDNLGFQIPHKHALTLCNSPYFVLLNNDTAVSPHWLGILEQPFKNNPKAALSGPHGNCSEITPHFHGRPGAFEYLEGSCLMCRTDIVKRYGLFSDYLEFAYGEDSDLSLRLREKGFTLHQVPVKILHWPSTTAKHVSEIRYYQEKNHLTLCKRWAHYLKVRKFKYPIVIKRKEAIGDVLLTSPIIRQLKRDRPLSPIYVITQFPMLFWKNPNVHTATTNLRPGADSLMINLDMAYENRPMRHILDSYAEVAGVTLEDHHLDMPIAEEKRQWAIQQLVSVHRPRVVIAPGPTTWAGKNWGKGAWCAVSSYLKQKGWAVILIGAANTHDIPCTIDYRGRTDIHQSAAILNESQMFMGLDSFPLHLAMSQRIPSIALFGVTSPEFILSSGRCVTLQADPDKFPEIGSRHRERGTTFTRSDGKCMAAIEIAQVIAAADEMIATL